MLDFFIPFCGHNSLLIVLVKYSRLDLMTRVFLGMEKPSQEVWSLETLEHEKTKLYDLLYKSDAIYLFSR